VLALVSPVPAARPGEGNDVPGARIRAWRAALGIAVASVSIVKLLEVAMHVSWTTPVGLILRWYDVALNILVGSWATPLLAWVAATGNAPGSAPLEVHGHWVYVFVLVGTYFVAMTSASDSVDRPTFGRWAALAGLGLAFVAGALSGLASLGGSSPASRVDLLGAAAPVVVAALIWPIVWAALLWRFKASRRDWSYLVLFVASGVPALAASGAKLFLHHWLAPGLPLVTQSSLLVLLSIFVLTFAFSNVVYAAIASALVRIDLWRAPFARANLLLLIAVAGAGAVLFANSFLAWFAA
jgi:hypothetical protein